MTPEPILPEGLFRAMRRVYEYRLYPTRAQAADLDTLLHIARTLYNAALEQRIRAWRGASRCSVGYNAQAADWTELRGVDPWFRTLNASAGQQVLRRLDRAFQRFFRPDTSDRRSGFPRFKGRNRWRSIVFVNDDGARIKRNRTYIQNVGYIKTKWHRPIPNDAAIKQIRIVRRLERWYVQFSLALPDPEPLTDGDERGVDLGIKAAAALSDGLLSLPVRPYRNGQAKLRRLQRRASRRKRGSSRRRKALRDVARHHERIARQRRDQLHKLSREVVTGAQLIALEDLRLAFMIQNRSLSKAASDTALGMLTLMIEYKAESAGARIIKVNPAFTSQDCSGCGSRVPKSLSDRVHACPTCGLVLDRDTNAAINVLHRARMEPSDANRGSLDRTVV